MLIVTLMLLVIFGLVYHFTSSKLESQSLSLMQNLLEDPFHVSPPGEGRDVQLPYFVLQLNRSGELIAIGGGYYDLSDEGFLTGLIEASLSGPAPIGIIEEYQLRYCRQVNLLSQRIAFVDISSERAILHSLVESCVLIGFLSAALFLAISMLLANWAVKPVDAAWRQQKRFVADASHELKTPLTVIMANAQLLSQPDYDEGQCRQFSAGILSMAKQMRELVEELLELARADSGQASEELKELDYSKLVADSVLPFEPLFYEKMLSLETHVEPGIQLRGREGQLKRLTEILLDNAGKYSLPEGRVELILSRQGRGHCQLQVSNPAPEMSREDCQNVFKRFYRADQARRRDGSYGLGLSIAESIVNGHGGKISCDYAGGIVSFRVLLPFSGR